MSEQPTNVISMKDYTPRKEGDVLSDETRFDLHRNNTVPNFDRSAIEAGRAAYAAASVETERPISRVEIAHGQLRMLNVVREQAKHPEETTFLQEEAA